MIISPLMTVSALFFVALVSALYLMSWAITSGLLRLFGRSLSHAARKQILIVGLILPPLLVAVPTFSGILFRHNGASALFGHHSMVCEEIFAPLLLMGNTGGAMQRLAGISLNGLAWLLMMGGSCLAARLLRTTLRLERGLSAYLAPPSPRLARALSAAAMRMPGRWTERFYEGPVPAACSSVLGVVRVRCILSAELVKGAGDDELEAIVAHEASHIHAGDAPLTSLTGILSCLFFYLSPVRLLAQRWREEAELACDVAAVAATRRPLALAAAILRVSGVPVSSGLPHAQMSGALVGFADAAACPPARRVELLIAQAQRGGTPGSGGSGTGIGRWLLTLGFSAIGVALLLSPQAACFAHCSLESVAHLLP